jgi:hypothetical protein
MFDCMSQTKDLKIINISMTEPFSGLVMGCDILTGRRVIKEHQIFNIILKTRGGRH